jgi:threonine dehydratase
VISIDDVFAAQQRLAGHVPETPFLHSRTLSVITGCELHLKFENLQFTASFKERGALNKLATLAPDEARRGVLAVSAGNHAQGVAYHAERLGIPAVIVMPRYTPTVKLENTRRFHVEVVLQGDTFDDARLHGIELAAARGLTMVHPYDDLMVAAGQGTIALEMLQACPELDLLCVPVGGGGLIAGMATAAKALKPGIEIIGVQTERFPSMYAAVRGQTMACAANTIAEGIAVKSPGTLTQEVVRRLVDDILLVSEAELEQAIVCLLEIEKTVVEGAGAAGLAAILRNPERFAGKRVGLVLTGGNIDTLMLAGIIQRGLVRSDRLVRLRVDIRDVPGALARITAILADHNANIEDVLHQRTFTDLPAQNVQVDFVLTTRGREHVQDIIAALKAAEFDAHSIAP